MESVPSGKESAPRQQSYENLLRMEALSEEARSSLMFEETEPQTFTARHRVSRLSRTHRPLEETLTKTESDMNHRIESIGNEFVMSEREDSESVSVTTESQRHSPLLLTSETKRKQWKERVRALESRVIIDFSQLSFIRKLGGSVREVWKARLWDMEVAVRRLKVHCNKPMDHSRVYQSSYSSTEDISHANSLRRSLESINAHSDATVACESADDSDHVCPEVAAELSLLKSLRHPNCALFLGYTEPPNFCLVMEYMGMGSLRELLDNPRVRMNSRHVVIALLSVARGLNYLHTLSSPLVHGDLNSSNILCHENWTIKIANYGTRAMMRRYFPHYSGGIPWRAPELLRDSSAEPTPKSDAYSLGIVAWELVTRQLPFPDYCDMEALRRQVVNGLRPDLPATCPEALTHVMRICWCEDPQQRPTMHELIEYLRPLHDRLEGSQLRTGVVQQQSSPTLVENDFTADVYAYGQMASDSELTFDVMPQVTSADSPSIADQLVSEVSLSSNSSSVQENLSSSSDLLIIPDDRQISLCLTSMVAFGRKDSAMGALSIFTNALPASEGAITLIDSMGAILWLGSFAKSSDLDSAQELFSTPIHSQAINRVCALSVRKEVIFSKRFYVRPTAKAALVVNLYVKDGFGPEMLEIFEQYAIPGLLSEVKAWRGALFSTHIYTNEALLVSLYESEAAMEQVVAQGFVQSQMLNFRSFLTDVPTVRKFAVVQSTFPEQQLSMPQSLLYSMSAAGKEAMELERETQKILRNTAQLTSKSTIVYKELPRLKEMTEAKPRPSPSLELHHQRRSLPDVPDPRRYPGVIHADMRDQRAVMTVLKKYGLPPSESLIKSFFVSSFDKHGSGSLHVTTSYLVFERRNVNSRRLVIIGLKNILRLRKGKETILPTKGHSLRIWTRSGKRHRARGIWGRDELLELLHRQALLQPPHEIGSDNSSA